jgi:hypothetical protein
MNHNYPAGTSEILFIVGQNAESSFILTHISYCFKLFYYNGKCTIDKITEQTTIDVYDEEMRKYVDLLDEL